MDVDAALGTFLGGVSASDESDASLVALRCTPAKIAGATCGMIVGSAGASFGMESGLGKSEPSVPVRCGGLVSSLCEIFVHAVQLTKAWSPLHPFFMHLCSPLSHVPPAAIFDLQPPMLKP